MNCSGGITDTTCTGAITGDNTPPHPVNTLFNLAVARHLFGFSMPMNNRNYPYGIPTSMMASLHTNMSVAVKNLRLSY